MDDNRIDGDLGPSSTGTTARPSSRQTADQPSDIEISPAIWVLDPGRRKVADAWLERGCVTHDCARDERPSWSTPRAADRLCRGDAAVGRPVTTCGDFDAVSGGDIIVVPINRRFSRLGVVVSGPESGCAGNEREVLWVSPCRSKAVAQRADELRLMSQLKQLG